MEAAAKKPPAGATRRRGPDLTSGPIGPTLIVFALPVLGSNIIQTLNGSVNTAWVSHILGEAALTASANAGQVFFLMIGVVFGISMAANIMIGQAVGARDEAAAHRVVGTCTVFFIAASLALALAGGIFTPAILDAMGTPADARTGAIQYLRMLFAAMPSVYFFNFVMMAQRGVGDSRTPLYFAILQVVLDTLLNPLLIIGVGPFPRMGIVGSAFATLLSQSIVLAAMLAHLYRKHSILVVRPSQWRLLIPDMGILKNLVFKGMPMGFQMIVISVAGLTMMRFVNGYGTDTAAAYGAAMQLWNYVQMPAMALGAGVSSMAAQNVGARRMDRVERVAWIGAACTLVAALVPIVLILLSQRFVLQAFLPAASPALPIAERINLIAIWSFIPFGVAFAFSGVVRATGVVWPPLLAMIIALWFVRIPYAEVMQRHWGADAVWSSFPLGSMVTMLLAIAYYRWGNWRSAKLIDTVPHGETPDPGQGPCTGIEETEVQAEAVENLKRPRAIEAS
ncbi:MAG TPA: MATE family efflux transporter [Phenylobacterium sp.]|uniref:MATE family efflux transporter n=1 Tax=Phenylobacterium sp. TaxID=1871053 RepID=UPI002B45A1DE|nr:MATE family efflux transporter [Phenylobacterium sp.]HKR88725.1 MATE family efflux transporter [Phenylobacterium sp.]